MHSHVHSLTHSHTHPRTVRGTLDTSHTLFSSYVHSAKGGGGGGGGKGILVVEGLQLLGFQSKVCLLCTRIGPYIDTRLDVSIHIRKDAFFTTNYPCPSSPSPTRASIPPPSSISPQSFNPSPLFIQNRAPCSASPPSTLPYPTLRTSISPICPFPHKINLTQSSVLGKASICLRLSLGTTTKRTKAEKTPCQDPAFTDRFNFDVRHV